MLIQTDGRKHEMDNNSNIEDNEVSEVNDYQSELIKQSN